MGLWRLYRLALRRSLSGSPDLRCRALGEQISLDKRVEVAVEDPVRITDFQLGAMVLDDAVRMQDVGTDLVSEGVIAL